ncbi:hypothetical protein GCM10010400_28880 [Streptomyces aculeolatus]|uniref:DUF5753 domain-containing protein n=1 Tax=Streptomyces aculeolatus TaxID=270689 RepID=UPI001CEDB6E1|nr:DUF5753 domain-containing protein [Streptomyces aculeolatus]
MDQHIPWQQRLSDGTAPVQEEIIDQYRAVRDSRSWIPTMIWGTLQTRAYASVILRQVVDFLGTPDDVEAGVAARMERQQVLYEPGRHFDVLLGEQALYTNIGGPAVMAGQMDRLLADFDQPTLRLGILPRTAEMPTLPVNAFNLHDNSVVHVELVSSGLDITSPDEIALHIKALDLLNDAAVHDDAARALIEQARTYWRRATTIHTS